MGTSFRSAAGIRCGGAIVATLAYLSCEIPGGKSASGHGSLPDLVWREVEIPVVNISRPKVKDVPTTPLF